MKGIRLSHGVIFVSDGVHTVKIKPTGECGISPILYDSLEWEMAHESPDKYEYLTQVEIENLPNDGYKKIIEIFNKINTTLYNK